MNILKLELKRSILASVIMLSVVLFSWTNIVVAQGNGNCGDCGGGSGHGILIPNSELDAYFAEQNRLRAERASASCEDCGNGPGSGFNANGRGFDDGAGNGPGPDFGDSGSGDSGSGGAGAGNSPGGCMGLPSRRGNPAPRIATSEELKAFFEEERRLNEEDRLANKEYLRACEAFRR